MAATTDLVKFLGRELDPLLRREQIRVHVIELIAADGRSKTIGQLNARPSWVAAALTAIMLNSKAADKLLVVRSFFGEHD